MIPDINLGAIEVSGAGSSSLLVADSLLTSRVLGTGAGAASSLGQGQRARAGLAAPAPPEGQPKRDRANAVSSRWHHELTSAGSAGSS